VLNGIFSLGRLTLTLLAGLTAAAALALTAGPASADPHEITGPDPFPCVQRIAGPINPWFCPLTQNKVPVYKAPDPASSQIGVLNLRGPTTRPRNFFLHQVRAELYSPPGKPNVVNDWWGYTRADIAGRAPFSDGWGYVPEVYFKGGDNFVPDAGLPRQAAPLILPDGF
jgi:hypothetical protein